MAELKGQRPEALFADWPEALQAENRKRTACTYTFIQPDGHEVPVEISTSPLRDEQGNNLGMVLLLRDLREIRSMEEQLARSQHLAALGRMAAGIAHEIRNPLGTLRGFAQYFGARAKDDDAREYSQLMIGEVDRLNATISSLLQFSRPRQPVFTRVRIAALFEKTKKLLEYDFQDAGVTLVEENQCLGFLEGDPDLLLQVLLNLLKNSLQASRRGDRITLSCREEQGQVQLSVTDQGAGMSRSEQEQMFDPFFTTKKGGTGLGLAVSYQIVEQHQGHFNISSRPGHGTRVTIFLPKKQNNQRDHHAAHPDS